MTSRRAVLALLLALLAAGCADAPGGSDEGGGPGSDPAASSPFLAPVALGSAGGPEPIIAVAPDGSVWVAAQDAGGGSPRVWISTDRGQSFVERRPSTLAGGEVDLAVASGLAVVTQLGPGGNLVSYSRDKGATWQQSTFAGTNYFERELVAIDGRGSIYLASRFGIRAITGQPTSEDATVARSDDGGVTFVPGGRIWDADHEPGLSIGNMIAYGSTVAVAYNCRDGYGVCFAKSVDRGLTWTQRLVVERGVDVTNYYPVLAADGDRIVVVWSDASEERLAVWASISRDQGGSWSSPTRVSEPAGSSTLPWVAASAGRTWVVHLFSDLPLTDAGAAEAEGAQWLAKAARLEADGTVVERALLVEGPVHDGVISKPLGRPGQGGPFDRRFGDFFTVATDSAGRAYVAVQRTTGSATIDLVVVER